MADREVTPDDLPASLVDKAPGSSFELEAGLLSARCGLERGRLLLDSLAQFAARGMKAGRKSLRLALLAQGQTLTEAEVRGVLQILADAGLIQSSIGRRGSELTRRGQQFANWLNNRSAE